MGNLLKHKSTLLEPRKCKEPVVNRKQMVRFQTFMCVSDFSYIICDGLSEIYKITSASWQCQLEGR